MEISSNLVGTRLRDYETEVSWRHIMNYAASLDDNNPLYFDDEREAGIIAPPMFCVAITWPIIERLWDFMESHDFPEEVFSSQVHHTENLYIHRLARPGDKLIIKGEIAAILPHRAGTYFVIRFKAVDKEGKTIFIEHNGGLLRGVKCTDEGRGQDSMPGVPRFKGKAIAVWESVIPIRPMAPFIYDGCSNIFFPIHTSVHFAHKVGLPGIILQGTATLGYAVRELINREAGRNPLELKSLDCRFSGMVFPGTDLRVQLMAKETNPDGVNLFFTALNSEGQKAISHGYARLE